MAKLKLKFTENKSVLSREEMKQVFGGYMSGSGETGSDCYWYRCTCTSPSSVIVGSTCSTYIKVTSLDDFEAKAHEDCPGYKNISCSKDKPC